MNLTERLKPCPFCGSETLGIECEERRIMPDSYQVGCWTCGAKGGTGWSKEEAANKWNIRG